MKVYHAGDVYTAERVGAMVGGGVNSERSGQRGGESFDARVGGSHLSRLSNEQARHIQNDVVVLLI